MIFGGTAWKCLCSLLFSVHPTESSFLGKFGSLETDPNWIFPCPEPKHVFPSAGRGSRSEEFHFGGRFWLWEMDFSGAQGCQDTWALSLFFELKKKNTFSSPSAGYDGRRHLPPGKEGGSVGEQLQRSPGGEKKSSQGGHKPAFYGFVMNFSSRHTPKTERFSQAVPNIPARNGARSGNGGHRKNTPPRISSRFSTCC